MALKFNYYIPTKIVFGKGSLDKLAKLRLPGSKALIVTGGTSTTRLGYVDRVVNLLKERNVESVVFNKVLPNPNHIHVNEGAEIIRNEGCDFIIGIGGGSSIDSAKAMSMAATNEGDCWDYISGKSKMKNKPLPVVAITTTAGTGTETDQWFVITNEEQNQKIGWGGDKFYPALSIVDPDLMMTVPPKYTAYQGFDALFHSVEGYIAKVANPMSDMYALKAIELIGKNLPAAVKNGSDEDARAAVALANTLSGMVEALSSCTSEHSMEHALSAFHPNLTHGAGLIMISCAYHKHFVPYAEERYVDMARALGFRDTTDPMDFVRALENLIKECDVDSLKMSDFGVEKSEIEALAANAMETGSDMMRADRVSLTKEDIIKIYEESYK
ncbi:MAG: iron-containing alcohol dehydrogenase [Bacillota bacterium]|nr:iron-containing alcohol dehydrogenase [Bacillota bacterium]